MASNRPIAGAAVYLGGLHLGFVIRRPLGFDAVTLRGELGHFNTQDAAARAIIALAAPVRWEE